MSNILSVNGLCKDYGSFSLSDVTFAVPYGYIMGFVGPNGAGKTTTIKSILGTTLPDRGEISILGTAPSSDKSQIMDDIGVVMDLPFYSDDWRARDVEAAVSPFYSRWSRASFDSCLERFKIPRDKKIKELSRGTKVKLMLAVALSHEARLLILDEPTSGLDPVARDELTEILGEFVSDDSRSVLFSTHITSDLEKIADYITFIMNGRVHFTGEKDTLLESYVLVKGAASDLTPEQRGIIIGCREHSFGFEGMIAADRARDFPAAVSCQRISLDEIIIYMNKGARGHE